MPTFPTVFKSSDSGAPALSGEVGKLLDVLDQTLVIGRVFNAPAADTPFVDNSVEARLAGGTAFGLLPGPTNGDRCYFGSSSKFARLIFDLSVMGIGGTYVWEFWNGTAWTTFTPTDGTSGFTADGTVSWSVVSLTGWVTTAVNGVTLFWVRVRASTAPSTNPTVNSISVLGWLRAFSGTNKAAYRSLFGARLYYRVDDSGPGAGLAKEARLTGYETMSDVDTGTGPFPTAAQGVGGIAMLVIRKSLTADATARTWLVAADERTAYVYVLTADVAGNYFSFGFGEVFSFVSGDLYNGFVNARNIENSSAGTSDGLAFIAITITATSAGFFIARSYTGIGTSLAVGKHSDSIKMGGTNVVGQGTLQYTNGADGGLYASPVWVHEIANATLRGLMRGFWSFLHPVVNITDRDTVSGTGDLAGKAFLFVKLTANGLGLYMMETSDTWLTN